MLMCFIVKNGQRHYHRRTDWINGQRHDHLRTESNSCTYKGVIIVLLMDILCPLRFSTWSAFLTKFEKDNMKILFAWSITVLQGRSNKFLILNSQVRINDYQNHKDTTKIVIPLQSMILWRNRIPILEIGIQSLF